MSDTRQNTSDILAITDPTIASKRKAELMGDQEWTQRYVSGDKQALNEMTALNTVLTKGQTYTG